MTAKTDCLHFNGYKPCPVHKRTAVGCADCLEYQKRGPLILIIKLQAAGEVVRNTPLLRKLEEQMPNARIFWLTRYPELLPNKPGLTKLRWGFEATLLVQDIEFDLLYSLDKDVEACALANRIRAKSKKGFTQKDGVILPFDQDCQRKWTTGFMDPLMKANTRHYVEEIFEICGFSFNNEPYWLPEFPTPRTPAATLDKQKVTIALNTGVGEMWRPRLYSPSRWIEVAKLLRAEGFEVFVAGGPAEHETNLEIAKQSGAHYFGTFPYLEFLGLLDLADVVVSSVSFAFHVAVGLKKKTVLLNNTFNSVEFYSYGRGVILEPALPCLKCYKNKFDSQCASENCMDRITPAAVTNEVIRLAKE